MLDRIKAEITAELGRSDIVWPKYGTESVDQLAERLTVRIGAIVDGAQDDWTTTCKRCESPLDTEGRCTDETCPYSDRGQDESFTEG